MLRLRVLSFILVTSFFNNVVVAIEIQEQLIQQFARAHELVKAGDIGQAIKAYQFILEKNPQVPEAYNNLAALYLKQNNVELAKVTLEQGLRAHEAYGALYQNLTEINIAMARDAYSKALQIDLKPVPLDIKNIALRQNSKKKSDTNKSDVFIDIANIASIEEKIATNPPLKVKIKEPTKATEVNRMLKTWSTAWSTQSIDDYLSFYHSNYKSNKGVLKKRWAVSRRLRLKKPKWIKVSVSDIKIMKGKTNEVVVTFKQSYRSNKFRDVTLKEMVLNYTTNGWKILREQSL